MHAPSICTENPFLTPSRDIAQIASIGEVAQCYRLRTLLLGHNRIRSVFGIEGLLELERVQLHGNAISGSSELRLIATLQKVKVKICIASLLPRADGRAQLAPG